MVRMVATLALACFCLVPPLARGAEDAPPAASVKGKYAKLLKVISIPDDAEIYTEFNDWGLWSGTEYRGHENLPEGYWVYVAPNWYIWGELAKEPKSVETAPVKEKPTKEQQVKEPQTKPDQFNRLMGKEVTLLIQGARITGKIEAVYDEMVVLSAPGERTVVMKKHVAAIRWAEIPDDLPK